MVTCLWRPLLEAHVTHRGADIADFGTVATVFARITYLLSSLRYRRPFCWLSSARLPRRGRKLILTVLVLACALLATGANTGIWLQRTVLDSNRFATTASSLLNNEPARAALSSRITDQILIQNPEFTAARPQILLLVADAVASPEFKPVFVLSVRQLHDQLVDNEEFLLLDTTGVLPVLAQRIQPTNPGLATLLSAQGYYLAPVVLATHDQAPVVWDLARFATNWSGLLVFAALLLLVAAVMLSSRRWLMLAVVADASALAMMAVGGSLMLAKSLLTSSISDVTNQKVFAAAWSAFTSSLYSQTLVVAAISLVLSLVAAIMLRRASKLPPSEPPATAVDLGDGLLTGPFRPGSPAGYDWL